MESAPTHSSGWPLPHTQKASREHNVVMRKLIRPWASLSSTPPGCRTVSFSSWSRFNASATTTKSSDELKASVLWTAHGTSTHYNPPPPEWTYLGAGQTLCDKPHQVEHVWEGRRRRRHAGSSSSWVTPSLRSGLKAKSPPVTFKREAPRRVNTSSLLTESFKSAPQTGAAGQIARNFFSREFNGKMASASMLTSVFDSDTEDEEDE